MVCSHEAVCVIALFVYPSIFTPTFCFLSPKFQQKSQHFESVLGVYKSLEWCEICSSKQKHFY